MVRWEYYPGLFRWFRCNQRDSCNRDTGKLEDCSVRGQTHRGKKNDVMRATKQGMRTASRRRKRGWILL